MQNHIITNQLEGRNDFPEGNLSEIVANPSESLFSRQTLMLQQLDIPNLVSITGLVCSFFAVIASVQTDFDFAMILLIGAGLTDILDGLIARKIQRTELQANIGKQLDSLVDICAFGLTPVIFAYFFGLQDNLSLGILLIYLIASALRLAFFNAVGLVADKDKQYFTGLPITSTALVIPIVFLANFAIPLFWMKLLLQIIYLLLAMLMVANVKIQKLSGIWYGIALGGGLGIGGIYVWQNLP
ncbi:CDP-alcohol phosphatidyltransferase family protein [Calothrix sp. 336/3]|uniref:CDP-alcohol phosphatidyltransferase family protein n=1 Tax=Calothrix sp. 336/3 TaxID=1337936 RepID=UPI0004E2A41C|nr:CDP-alcohol phosphatidyltransferase family protein [Calothrix sp. 336/3]AKG20846.1 hypothetical protein IJ00_05590 [Calothrix sp. 336/3]